MNDTDHQPRSEVYTQAADRELIQHALETPSCDPTKWAWEKYSSQIWRAIPLTLEDLCGSPIYELILELEVKWRRYLTHQSLLPTTWVLQRVPSGCEIGKHNDEFTERRVAFVYYLTPDDWDLETDAGALCVQNKKIETDESIQIRVSPKFNSLVSWFLKTPDDPSIVGSPVHWVETVRATDDRPRIALVGFWSKVTWS
jgi:hypothetical protein